tara:strand:- start:192 stop:386 length:195 start_codon:yes stop_codon:yes gene_type:complete
MTRLSDKARFTLRHALTGAPSNSDCGREAFPERDPAAKACPAKPRAGQADPFLLYRDGVMPWEV